MSIELDNIPIPLRKDTFGGSRSLGQTTSTTATTQRAPSHLMNPLFQATLPEGAGVLGGEACMWGEYVDGGALDYKVWPRTAAVAERLWSNPTRDTASAEPRFNTHRERLIARGLRPDAVSPKWCQQNEGECY